MEKKLSLRLV